MEILQRGDYKPRKWSLEVECEGYYTEKERVPCHSFLEIDEDDIVKRLDVWIGDDTDVIYGFICCECHAFTEVKEYIIPSHVKAKCPSIAKKGSTAYRTLSEAEKKLSECLEVK